MVGGEYSFGFARSWLIHGRQFSFDLCTFFLIWDLPGCPCASTFTIDTCPSLSHLLANYVLEMMSIYYCLDVLAAF